MHMRGKNSQSSSPHQRIREVVVAVIATVVLLLNLAPRFHVSGCCAFAEVCPPGFGLYSQDVVVILCIECTEGFYKGNYGNDVCTACPAGFITEGTRATTQDNCTVRE